MMAPKSRTPPDSSSAARVTSARGLATASWSGEGVASATAQTPLSYQDHHDTHSSSERKSVKTQNPTFVRQFFGVVMASLLPVVLTAFLSIPFSLGAHPGEIRSAGNPAQLHMT